MVCSQVVWIAGMSLWKRLLLRGTRLESQTTGPQTTKLSLVDKFRYKIKHLLRELQSSNLSTSLPPAFVFFSMSYLVTSSWSDSIQTKKSAVAKQKYKNKTPKDQNPGNSAIVTLYLEVQDT